MVNPPSMIHTAITHFTAGRFIPLQTWKLSHCTFPAAWFHEFQHTIFAHYIQAIRIMAAVFQTQYMIPGHIIFHSTNPSSSLCPRPYDLHSVLSLVLSNNVYGYG